MSSIWINYWDSDEETEPRKPKLKPKPKLKAEQCGTDWATIATGVTVGVVAGAAIVYGVKQLFKQESSSSDSDSDEEIKIRDVAVLSGPSTTMRPLPQPSTSTNSSPGRTEVRPRAEKPVATTTPKIEPITSRSPPATTTPVPVPTLIPTTSMGPPKNLAPAALPVVRANANQALLAAVPPQMPPAPPPGSRPAVIFTPTPRSSIRRPPPVPAPAPVIRVHPKPTQVQPPPPPPIPSSHGIPRIPTTTFATVNPNSSMAVTRSSTPPLSRVPLTAAQTPLAALPGPTASTTSSASGNGEIVLAVTATPNCGGGLLVLHDAAELYHYSLDWQDFLKFPGRNRNTYKYETTNAYIALELFSPMIEVIQEQNPEVKVTLKVDEAKFQRQLHLTEDLGEEAEFWEFVQDIKSEVTDSEWTYVNRDGDPDLARAHLLSQSGTDIMVTMLKYKNYKHIDCSDAAMRTLKKNMDVIPSDYVIQN